MKIHYAQLSPRGNAELDTGRLLVGTDGKLFVLSGTAVAPLHGEAEAALRARLGALVSDALSATAALA